MATILEDFTIYLLMFRDLTLRRLDLNCVGLINSLSKTREICPITHPPQKFCRNFFKLRENLEFAIEQISTSSRQALDVTQNDFVSDVVQISAP